MNIIDDYNRESLAVEVDTSLPSQRVIRVLERLLDFRGKPDVIRVDNGPEFISDKLKMWCDEMRCAKYYFATLKMNIMGDRRNYCAYY